MSTMSVSDAQAQASKYNNFSLVELGGKSMAVQSIQRAVIGGRKADHDPDTTLLLLYCRVLMEAILTKKKERDEDLVTVDEIISQSMQREDTMFTIV